MSELKTRLSEFFGIQHPILSAPMALAAGGRLASSVTKAGGLGFIGGAYGDGNWMEDQYQEAGNTPVGIGFITWHLEQALKQFPNLLDDALAKQPSALFLSFGDPEPHTKKIEAAGVPLICQVQTLPDAERALGCDAKVIVAQGCEAGGHGLNRATMTLVPEVADLISRNNADAILCAAGGIADGRGLAASLMLGAEGVLVGSRLWASEEALVHPKMLEAAIKATGDDTIRSSVMDIARHLKWPPEYTARVLKNGFTKRWHNDIEGLLANADEQASLWKEAWASGDTAIANTFVGEASGLIDSILPAEKLIKSMVKEAEERLALFNN
ncbi:MAG: nitronate monooxygenase [Rhizobiaceae bacterium]